MTNRKMAVAILAAALAVAGLTTLTTADAGAGGGDITFTNDMLGNVTFSHDFHVTTKGNTCDACHPDPFQMKKGANAIKFAEFASGKWCGKCHKAGGPAFDPTTACDKCHKK